MPSLLYSFSFAPNPDWSRTYSPQAEIQAYAEKVAADAGVLDRFHFGVELLGAAWDDDAALWRVRTSAGDLTCTTLINATGGLSAPKLPDLEGIDTFDGHLFHTAQWDHSVDLTGKRVAVIGTGASAVQVIPAIQPVVGHLDVYQRSAPWVLPKGDRAFTDKEKRLFRRFPSTQKALRARMYWFHEALVPGITRQQRLNAPVERLGRMNLARGVKDHALRERLRPTFDVFCKRILLSDDYYPAMSSANVEVVTDPIARVTPLGCGHLRRRRTRRSTCSSWPPASTRPTRRSPSVIRGRDGRTLAETWAATGMAAYKGAAVRGFPNLLSALGPNTGQGHTSVLLYIEAATGYIRDALRTMRRQRLGTIEPRADVQARWNADLQRRMKRTVWTRGGCSSWYLDEHGRNTVLWPRTTGAFRRAMKEFDLAAYDVRSRQS